MLKIVQALVLVLDNNLELAHVIVLVLDANLKKV